MLSSGLVELTFGSSDAVSSHRSLARAAARPTGVLPACAAGGTPFIFMETSITQTSRCCPAKTNSSACLVQFGLAALCQEEPRAESA